MELNYKSSKQIAQNLENTVKPTAYVSVFFIGFSYRTIGYLLAKGRLYVAQLTLRNLRNDKTQWTIS